MTSPNPLKTGNSFCNLKISYDKSLNKQNDKYCSDKYCCHVVILYITKNKDKDPQVTVPAVWQELWQKIQPYTNHKQWQAGDSFCHVNDTNKAMTIFVCGGKNKQSVPAELGKKIHRICGKLQAANSFVMYLPDEYMNNVNYLFTLLHDINFANYAFNKYISGQDSANPATDAAGAKIKNIILYCSQKQYDDIDDVWNRMKPFMWAKSCTMDWGNEPANIINPRSFVESLKATAPANLKIEIWSVKELEQQKANALLAVAQGSAQEPYVAILSWVGKENDSEYDVALAGKGVTFDTGGIDLKPSSGLKGMKFDMCGAATVAGILYGLAKSKAPVNVLGVLGLVENMPSGLAQRPNDIVKSMSGKTIEVLNTDAEGRMVLADILTIMQNNYRIKNEIITVATLTGSVVVALGEIYGGIFSHHKANVDNIIAVADSINENLWPLPLHHKYDEMINSKVADVANISTTGYGAGSSTAAHFVGRFVQDEHREKWIHLDIAGVASVNDFATGFGVLALSEWIRKTYS